MKIAVQNFLTMRRVSVLLLSLVLLGAVFLTVNAALLAIDRPLTSAQVSAREEQLNLDLFRKLKKARDDQRQRSSGDLPIIRDPFVGP